MSRSYHVTERQRKRDHWLNRESGNKPPTGLSKLDELALKKKIAKENEAWKRATAKSGGLRRTKFGLKDGTISVERVKCRGKMSGA
jgi:hypothetical protein